MNRKSLRAGDVVQLIALAYGEPDGPCTVIADQEGGSSLDLTLHDIPQQLLDPVEGSQHHLH